MQRGGGCGRGRESNPGGAAGGPADDGKRLEHAVDVALALLLGKKFK